MAVGIANATGILKYAVAIDYEEITKVQEMSLMYSVMFPENFEMP